MVDDDVATATETNACDKRVSVYNKEKIDRVVNVGDSKCPKVKVTLQRLPILIT